MTDWKVNPLSTNIIPEACLTTTADYHRLVKYLQGLPESHQRVATRHLLRTDLYFLLRFGLKRPDVENGWLLARCKEIQANPNKHLDLWAREHYKSTIITFAKTIQDVLASHGDDPLTDREYTFGIFSHTRPSAKGFLRQIKQELETNDDLKALFPDVLYVNPKGESPKWSEDEGLIVKRKGNPKESTIEAHGLVDGQPTGKHYFVRVYDDVVTLESVRTREMINKTTEAWEMSLNLGADGGLERYIGTFYADGDTYHDIIDRDILTVRKKPGTTDGTLAGDPVYWSDETLAYKKRAMGPQTFSTQILLDPIPSDASFFTRDSFHRFDLGTEPENLNHYGGSDYAVTDGGGDYTEHGVVGLSHDDKLYFVDWWSGQTKSDVWIEEQLDLVRQYKPLKWVGETGPIKSAVEPFLTKRMRERRTFVSLVWLSHAKNNKEANARSFQALVEAGRVYIPNTQWGDELIDQLVRFPKGRFDDKVDVCSLISRMIQDMWANSPKKEVKKKQRDRWDKAFDDEASDWKVA